MEVEQLAYKQVTIWDFMLQVEVWKLSLQCHGTGPGLERVVVEKRVLEIRNSIWISHVGGRNLRIWIIM